MMKTFEDMVSEIETAGFRLNNLFRRTDGLWLGNVRSTDSTMFEYGIASTAQEAMQVALENAFKRWPLARQPKTFIRHAGMKVPDWETYQPPAVSAPDADEDLLGLEDATEREIAEAAGAVSEVDDLLG